MQTITLELKATLRATVAIEDGSSTTAQELLRRLPHSLPSLFQQVEVRDLTDVSMQTCGQAMAHTPGIHQFRVVFLQEYPPDDTTPRRVEVIASSRADAFALMKCAETMATFSRVEVENLQGGIEARMVSVRAGFAVVESKSQSVIASRLSQDDARARFAMEVSKKGAPALSLVDYRHPGGLVLAQTA